MHSELFKFLESSNIVESDFKFKDGESIKKVSLNGYFSKDIIETIISCLFQRGFDNIINSFPYKSLKGTFQIDQKVYEYIGRLKQELESFNLNINSYDTIDTTILEKRGENFNLSNIKDQVNTYLNYDQFKDMIECKFDENIKKIKNVKNEITQRFLNLKSKANSNFKIDSNIIDKYFPSIFEDLKYISHFKGNYKDFEKLMSGITPTDKIGIKEITSMGTFVNWLVDIGLILKNKDNKIDWKFIAENLYLISSKDQLISSQFSKNALRHKNSDVSTLLDKYKAVIKSHLNQQN